MPQVHFNCIPEVLRKYLSPMEHRTTIINRMDSLNFYFGKQCFHIYRDSRIKFEKKNLSDPATIRRLGSGWFENCNLFMYHFRKRREIDKECFIYRWFSASLHHHNHLLLMYLLDRSETASKTQRTQYCYPKIKWFMSHS